MSKASFLNNNGFIIVLFLFLSIGCRNDRNKHKLKNIIPICNQHLFVEKYEVRGGGAYDGDLISAYLTDSTSFRLYLNTYDNAHEGIAFECLGKDSVSVHRQAFDTVINKLKIIDTTIYSLSELRKKRVFD